MKAFNLKAGMLYISIGDDTVRDMVDIDYDIRVEYNKNGGILGIEICHAKELIVPEILKFFEPARTKETKIKWW